MHDRIVELLSDLQVASQCHNSYGLLPDVISVLQQILANLEIAPLDKRLIVKGAGALGRIVTDNYQFSESELGTRLLQLINDLAAEYT